MAIESADNLELIDRYRFLIVEYVKLAPELATKLEQFGRLKKELEVITAEFIKRKVNIEDLDKEIKKEEKEK